MPVSPRSWHFDTHLYFLWVLFKLRSFLVSLHGTDNLSPLLFFIPLSQSPNFISLRCVCPASSLLLKGRRGEKREWRGKGRQADWKSGWRSKEMKRGEQRREGRRGEEGGERRGEENRSCVFFWVILHWEGELPTTSRLITGGLKPILELIRPVTAGWWLPGTLRRLMTGTLRRRTSWCSPT